MRKLNPKNYIEGHSVDDLEVSLDDLLLFLENVPFDSGVVEMVLDFLADHEINVDILTQTAPVGGKTENAFIIGKEHLREAEELKRRVEAAFPGIKVILTTHIARLSLSGIGMRTQSGVAARFLGILSELNIPILVVTTSEIRIAAVINSDDLERAKMALESGFGLESEQTQAKWI